MFFTNQFAPLAASASASASVSANAGSAKRPSTAGSSGKTVRRTASRLSTAASKKANAVYRAANKLGSSGIQIKIEELEDNFRYLLSGEEASSSRLKIAVSDRKKNIVGLPKKTRFGPVPAIPARHIISSYDRKMAQGSSFASVAKKGVPKGAQLNLPSRFAKAKSSWHGVQTSLEDWLFVEDEEKGSLGRELGVSFAPRFAFVPEETGSGKMVYKQTVRDIPHVQCLNQVNQWLDDQRTWNMPPPDVIELFNSRGEVVQMFKQPKKYEDKVVIDRKDKGKEKALFLDSEEEAAIMIIGGIVNGTPRLDKVIEEALNGNLWYDSGKKQENASKSSKDFYENNWQQVPIKSQASTSGWHQPPLKYSNQWMEQPVASSSKPEASSSQQKKKPKKWVKLDLAAVEKANIDLARQQHLSNQKDRYHYTHPKRVISDPKSQQRVEANFINAKKHNGNIMIRLRGRGWIAHSLEKPVWDIPGFCYLAAIKDEMLNQRDWPAFPNLTYLSG